MPTASGHTRAILASRVRGTSVYNSTGEKIGHVEDLILDKTSDNILFAALGWGGVLGVGEKYAPIPWSVLDFSPDKDGYVVPVSKALIEKAPTYQLEDLTRDDGSIAKEASTIYGVVRPH